MPEHPEIHIEDYRYNLPDEYIARYPLPERESSQLLFYDRGSISHSFFQKIPQLLPTNSWLVFNNTRVIQARLTFRKATGARVEVFCLEPFEPVDYQQALQSTSTSTWVCLVGNAKKWKQGPLFLETEVSGSNIKLEATRAGEMGDKPLIKFSWDNRNFSFGQIIEASGSTPIPPYLKRDAEESDRERYQTIYSRPPGSVAAPTAGLHFSRKMWDNLAHQGIPTGEVTLHVGAGTFVPVKTGNARLHSMHSEVVSISREFLETWKNRSSDLIAVGTTTTRSLESLYWLGVRLLSGKQEDPEHLIFNQWENENLPDQVPLEESLDALLFFLENSQQEEIRFSTSLMIVPGYRFRTISGLVTNFHLPGSTLLLLIAALIGEDWRRVYAYALANQFRFLSYGDSSLLLPRKL